MKQRANFSKFGLAKAYQGLVYIGGSEHLPASYGYALLASGAQQS